MKVVAGLGNPGIRYLHTRHNIGFLVVDSFMLRHEMQWEQNKFKGRIGRGSLEGHTIVFVKPQAYMNRSGEVIAPLMKWISAVSEDLIVVHDDVDLSFGRIRIRRSGSAAGHKGVQSIIDAIGSADFLRVRMGIGRPEEGQHVDEYVLERFPDQETDALHSFLDQGVKALEYIFSEGVSQAMTRFNTRRQMVCNGEKETTG